MDKKAVRARFSKEDRAVYISNLDLLRTMQRALKRARIPVWYSEGFNPRIYLSFPLALSVGIRGLNEPMDFDIIEDMPFEDIAEKLNGTLPEGLHINKVYSPVHRGRDIFSAEYRITAEGASGNALSEFINGEKITVKKHTKKNGDIPFDVKPFTDIVSVSETAGITELVLRLPAGNEMNISLAAFIDAFAVYCAENGIETDKICAERTNILCDNNVEFV